MRTMTTILLNSFTLIVFQFWDLKKDFIIYNLFYDFSSYEDFLKKFPNDTWWYVLPEELRMKLGEGRKQEAEEHIKECIETQCKC